MLVHIIDCRFSWLCFFLSLLGFIGVLSVDQLAFDSQSYLYLLSAGIKGIFNHSWPAVFPFGGLEPENEFAVVG